MENSTKISIGTLIIVIVGFTSFSIIGQEDTHYCLDAKIKNHCDELTRYYGLENGKCINNLGKNKLCRSGWEEIPIIPVDDPDIPFDNNLSWAQQYKCSPLSCEVV